MNTRIQWAAELAHVREVSLLGTADLGFWRDRLADEDLAPLEKDGKAQILIAAASLRFMGIRLRELSFSVLVAPPQAGSRRDAAFLVRAFNSSRCLAVLERRLFSTPYSFGDVLVSSSVPCSIQLGRDGGMVFRAAMQPGAGAAGRQPAFLGEESWFGPIFLPGSTLGKAGQGKVFFGRLSGHTRRYPFRRLNDSLAIRAPAGCEVLRALIDSHFAAAEWMVRDDAAHARSKTYRRSDRSLFQ